VVSSFEGILDPCLVLVRLSLLLPSRMMENAIVISNG